MSTEYLPIIDWIQATKVAGNKTELAEEMFRLFLVSMPADIEEIKKHYYDKNFSQMQKDVHKFHGALCYCGLPRLKNVIETLEFNLKNRIYQTVPQLMLQLDKEITSLLKEAQPIRN